MDMIGQRLFTGRVAVAQAALTFVRRLFDDTKRYSDQKPCTMRGDSPALTDVPQLRALYDEGGEEALAASAQGDSGTRSGNAASSSAGGARLPKCRSVSFRFLVLDFGMFSVIITWSCGLRCQSLTLGN